MLYEAYYCRLNWAYAYTYAYADGEELKNSQRLRLITDVEGCVRLRNIALGQVFSDTHLKDKKF